MFFVFTSPKLQQDLDHLKRDHTEKNMAVQISWSYFGRETKTQPANTSELKSIQFFSDIGNATSKLFNIYVSSLRFGLGHWLNEWWTHIRFIFFTLLKGPNIWNLKMSPKKMRTYIHLEIHQFWGPCCFFGGKKTHSQRMLFLGLLGSVFFGQL